MDAEDYRERREAQQERRRNRLPERQREIEALAPQHQVEKLTPYQYRIDGVIDLYPIHRRWHWLETNKRGSYRSISEIIKKLD